MEITSARWIPETAYSERLLRLEHLVRHECPSSHVDYYVFCFVITCVMCSAGFSLAAQSADISMWYPLILLLIPAGLSFWTSRRRGRLGYRVNQFECTLKQTLREFNKVDCNAYNVHWSFRRPAPTDPDTPHLVLRSSWRLCLVIQVASTTIHTHRDNSTSISSISTSNEELPSYQSALLANSTSNMTVVDMNPFSPEHAQSSSSYRLPPPSYSQTDVTGPPTLNSAFAQSALFLSPSSSRVSLLPHDSPSNATSHAARLSSTAEQL
ncbi:hypothetical protein BCR43DRAFT_520634 [Syncephalastrum racemosum]|uniref:Uncharacterized protein n=1 Tax=Syncephalastrum racemosum TaxID=13706 RepID=A0A1X2HWN0_SYNRA|nr:hypothetical protein BCR43DRAFT_520634 [Syncephalastrum racemosum]